MFNVRKFPLVSDQIDYKELETIVTNLEFVLDRKIAGSIVELGCYEGTTSLFLQRILCERQESRQFRVYDSFAGLPDKTSEDQSPAGEQLKAGELSAKKPAFIAHFKHAGLPLPTIHKAWFDQLTDKDLPETIAFAFLDGDFYTSIKTSLHLIEKRLSKGAVIIVDDYQSEALPGAAKAVHEWISARPHLSVRPAHSLAVITDS